ncbi:carbamoyltransferase N-terminal domain-containing protein [Streptomyces camelliae]|uniref:Nodulation protein U n=1 Tax=Streptomyces camelliae TaxID=3004093 RepID=A0ABY7P6D2_9ACTN|nr:carbamoyltransferase N-terminal domain-containing protein [Streptomyces sp. HUAS 2-6]WBO65110.1 nodulation protein U [Streptomyces sp. HUAS 2-6]
MIICGLKLTHDGAVALLDDDTLVFSVEIEKIANGRRYSEISDLDIVPRILGDFGYKVEDVDEWVVDGWDGDDLGRLELSDHGTPVSLVVGPYRESKVFPDLLSPSFTGNLKINGEVCVYTSYPHAAGHLASAYASSPFASRQEPAFVLVWDGGLFPRLYWVEAGRVENGGELFPMIGHAYATAGHHFGPFRRTEQSANVDDLTIAGKLMAYIALGRAREEVLVILRETFHKVFESDSPEAVEYRRTVGGFGSLFERSMPPLHRFYDEVRERVAPSGISDEDVLASVHTFLGELLLERIAAKIRAWKGDGPWNLCFVGGCALNIKWNSALRSAPLFSEVWVPPFPNDSGSAIGGAVLAAARHTGLGAIEWHARLGPALTPTEEIPDGWTSASCDPAQLARLLHESGEPVVLLNGRAELGPRALGARSIIAAPTSAAMKAELNRIKGRESYRPVAPLCLVEQAPEIFEPGTPDPYMLFDHQVRESWTEKIPAVIHLDGTARLQTVAQEDDPVLAEVLNEYHRLSGVPVLCNTSANLNGSGFFPDVASAMAWGRVDRIWSEGVLYSRTAPAVTLPVDHPDGARH